MDYQILKQPPIDLVYLWCDDNDKEWNTKRLQYMRREKLLDVQAVHSYIDAYLKTDYQACINYFKSEADKTSRQRFRQDGALHRVVVSYYMMAAGHAVIKPVKDIDINLPLMEKLKRFVLRQKDPDSFCPNIHLPRGFAKLMRIRPKLFCINDTEKGSVENVDVKIFLEKMFPDKCDFEL